MLFIEAEYLSRMTLSDQSLIFAARRNIPLRYNRDHVSTTLKAMQRITEIRAKRERRFYKERMAGNKEKERAADRKLVAENEHLLPRIRASERTAMEAMEVEEPLVETAKATAKVPVQRQQEKTKAKSRIKQRLLVGGGVQNEMDVD